MSNNIQDQSTSTELAETTDHTRPVIYDPINSPEHPNPLIGTVVSYDMLETAFGARAIVLVAEETTGIVWSRLIAGAVLESQFAGRRPIPGETIRLEYIGESVSQSGKFEGKGYHNWDLRVRRPPQVPDWESLGAGEVKLIDARTEPNVPIAVTEIEPDVPIAEVEEETTVSEAEGDDLPF